MCKKRCYDTKLDAMLVLARCNYNGRKDKRRLECRVYYCPVCECWHLTKQRKLKKKKKMCETTSLYLEEFINFAGLAKEDSGLGVDIFFDQCNSYKEYNHPFWVYFRNSYGNEHDYIPITVEDKNVLSDNRYIKVFQKDINEVIKFIGEHYDDICSITDGKMDVYDLYKKLIKQEN